MSCFSGQSFYVELSQKMGKLIFELATFFDEHPTFQPTLYWVTCIKTTMRHSSPLLMKSFPLLFPSLFSITSTLQNSLLAAKKYMLDNSLSIFCCCFFPLRFNSENFEIANIVNWFWENSFEQVFVPVYFTISLL